MITHPDKLLFPSDGISKGELAAYYMLVAPVMLPHLRGRPITMERFPAGIEHKGFMQKDVVKGYPQWLPRVEVPKRDGTTHYALIDEPRALLLSRRPSRRGWRSLPCTVHSMNATCTTSSGRTQ